MRRRSIVSSPDTRTAVPGEASQLSVNVLAGGVVAARSGDLEARPLERLGSIGEEALDRVDLREHEDHDQDQVRRERLDRLPWYSLAYRLRSPQPQVAGDGAEGGEGRNDVGQLDGDVVRRDELCDCERRAGQQRDGPGLAQATAAVDDVDDHQRHEQGQERELAPDHRAEVALVDPGHARERDDGQADAPERRGRRIADQCDAGRFQRLEAEREEHPGRYGDGCAEAGERLQQGAEREPDYQRLDALVAGGCTDAAAQRLEVAGGDGHRVDPQRVHHDPHDRKEPERGACAGAAECLSCRHPVHGDRDCHGHGQRNQAGEVGPQPQPGQQHEQRHQRQDREQRAQPERAADRVVHLLVHTAEC